MELALVVLAAGMGSRYGGLKQIATMLGGIAAFVNTVVSGLRIAVQLSHELQHPGEPANVPAVNEPHGVPAAWQAGVSHAPARAVPAASTPAAIAARVDALIASGGGVPVVRPPAAAPAARSSSGSSSDAGAPEFARDIHGQRVTCPCHLKRK